jgi:hypothetical protein
MNYSPTITAQEFKNIHNGLCELNSVIGRLDEGVLSPRLHEMLVSAKAKISAGLVGAYDQEDADFKRKREHYDSVMTDLGLDAVWSDFEVKDLNATHPFEGAKEVVYRNHWGEQTVRVPIYGWTWAALYVAANAAIRDSGDDHHIFIEHFDRSGDSLILSTGS